MYPIDLTTYFPELETIPQEDRDSARARLVAWLSPYFADTDMAPGSVLGDRGIAPISAALAAMEVALGRVMSDMIPENVAAGTMYNCDFISKFLANFGVYDLTPMESSGIIRLTFTSDILNAITLDPSVMFQFGPSVFKVRQTTLVYPSSSAESTRLRPSTSASWAVDVVVTGVAPGVVAAGTSGAISVSLPNLSSVSAVTSLAPVSTPDSLVSLAKLTQRASTSGNSTPAGMEGFIGDKIKNTRSADVIVAGDPEFVNSGGTISAGWQKPEAVLFFRSTDEMQTVTQTFDVAWDSGSDSFSGELPLLYPPEKILSLSPSSDLSVDLMPDAEFSTEGTPGSYAEVYSVSIPQVPGLVGFIGSDNNQHASLSITYLCDPAVKQAWELMSAERNRPVGVDVKVMRPVTAWVSEMTVHYVKKTGVTMNLTQARSEIASYINECCSPENLSESHIVDSMRWAGASKVNSIVIRSRVSRTAADLLSLSAVNASLDGADRSLVDETTDLGGSGFPFTIRTRRFMISPDIIVFREDG